VIMVRCQQSDRPIRVYPNPAREQLYIQGASAGTRYQLFNNVGQMVQNGQI